MRVVFLFVFIFVANALISKIMLSYFEGVKLFTYMIPVKVLLISLIYIKVKKTKLCSSLQFNKSKILLSFYFTLILLAFFLSVNIYNSVKYTDKIIFLVYCLCVGFFEEILFRVFLYNNLSKIKVFKNRSIALIIFTSLIFGLIHLINFMHNTTVYSVLNQVVLAFGLGLLLQTIFYKFSNYFFIGILHGLINFFGSFQSSLILKNNDIRRQMSFSEFFNSQLVIWIFLIVVISPICAIVYKLKNSINTQS